MRKLLFLLLMLLPTVADAALFDFEVDGIYYKISNGSNVSVARTYYGNDYSGNVTIPSSVTYNGTTYTVMSIGSSAFYYCTGLTSISIPNSITSISGNAFEGCSSLDTVYISDIGAWCNIYFNKSNGYCYANPLRFAEHFFLNGVEVTDLIIPASVTTIGSYAFYCYHGLRSITIGDSVTSIGESAFYGCSGLTSIAIPNSVTSIGNSVFGGCTGLTSIDLPNSVTSIGNSVFGGCTGLTSIDLPNSVTSIGERAFGGCTGLTSIDIPNSVTSIGDFAFQDCKSLTGMDIPNSVTYIGERAFQCCISMTSFTMGNSVTFIGDDAFHECSRLTDIVVAVDNPIFDSRENCNAIIETASNTLIRGGANSFIPNSVTSIGNDAFSSSKGLTSFSIPNSVTTIGDNAFQFCTNLTRINIPNSVTYIGDYAFSDCQNLTSINIPSSVTAINSHTFLNCNSLTSITIPNSVTSIADYVLDYCRNLKSLEIPNSLTTIHERAFWQCFAERLIISGEGEWKVRSSTLENFPDLFIDSHITAIKGLNARHSDVYCFAATPPLCDINTFLGYSGTLHVPASSLAAYFTADYWSNFENIVGDAVEPNLTISQDSVEVNLGDQLYLSVTNETPYSIIWESTNPTVATVDSYGTVTAVGAGECDIIAQCLYKRDSCHVMVNDTTVTIILDQQEAMLLPNHIITLTPSASPVVPDGYAVTSSDPSVAAARVVNNKVQVVGIKEGTTTITVGSVDGTAIPATCLVTVYTEPGDLDCDGFVNISDVTSLIDYLLSGEDSQISTKNADVDGDGAINISDVTELIDILLRGD